MLVGKHVEEGHRRCGNSNDPASSIMKELAEYRDRATVLHHSLLSSYIEFEEYKKKLKLLDEEYASKLRLFEEATDIS